MQVDTDPMCRWEDRLLGSDRYPEVPVVFGRTGIYLQGNDCWVEVAGRAFKYDASQFKYALGVLHASEYDDSTYAALSKICGTKLATKQQRRLLWLIRDSRDIANTKRNARLWLKTMELSA